MRKGTMYLANGLMATVQTTAAGTVTLKFSLVGCVVGQLTMTCEIFDELRSQGYLQYLGDIN